MYDVKGTETMVRCGLWWITLAAGRSFCLREYLVIATYNYYERNDKNEYSARRSGRMVSKIQKIVT